MRTLWSLIMVLLLAAAQLPADILYSVTTLGSSGSQIYGKALNEAGQVTGLVDRSVFLYSDGQITVLSELGNDYPAGNGIDNAGQVTGIFHPGNDRAFLYSHGQVTDLGTLGGNYSHGYAINSAGQVTGDAESSRPLNSRHVFLYSNGQMTDLGNGYGLAINDVGQVTGSNGTHAFLYSNGQMQDLGTLGGYESASYGLNNRGQVVGWSTLSTTPNPHAFLYSDGRMYDLNDLIDPALRITLGDARAINDHGQIVANAGSHAYLLTPVPEPSTLALFGVALLGLTAWARCHPERATPNV